MTFQTPIQSELAHFDKVFPKAFASHVPLLNVILKYAIKKKGKRLRPALVFLMAKALNGSVSERSTRAATLVELMHTATLVHDDVVDQSLMRRGSYSIQALWQKKVAVLVGDYMLSRVLLLAVEHKDHDLLGHVSQAVKAMSEGELLQMAKARRLDIDEAVYEDVIRQKTASLMAACCVAGAASVDADEAAQAMARAFGEALGMAFQIQDDLLDFDRFATTGKPAGIDVKEQKMTLPLIHALSMANTSQRREMVGIVKKKTNDPRAVASLMSTVVQLGGVRYAVKRMGQWQDEALTHLHALPESASKESLKALVDFVASRRS